MHQPHVVIVLMEVCCDLLLFCSDTLWVQMPVRVEVSSSDTQVLHSDDRAICQVCRRAQATIIVEQGGQISIIRSKGLLRTLFEYTSFKLTSGNIL